MTYGLLYFYFVECTMYVWHQVVFFFFTAYQSFLKWQVDYGSLSHPVEYLAHYDMNNFSLFAT